MLASITGTVGANDPRSLPRQTRRAGRLNLPTPEWPWRALPTPEAGRPGDASLLDGLTAEAGSVLLQGQVGSDKVQTQGRAHIAARPAPARCPPCAGSGPARR